jgi:hypothetical protein
MQSKQGVGYENSACRLYRCPDDIPNLPHVDVDQAAKYALAKIKEAVVHVRGSRIASAERGRTAISRFG